MTQQVTDDAFERIYIAAASEPEMLGLREGVRRHYDYFKQVTGEQPQFLFLCDTIDDSGTPLIQASWLFGENIASEANRPIAEPLTNVDFVIYRHNITYFRRTLEAYVDSLHVHIGQRSLSGVLSTAGPSKVQLLEVKKLLIENLVR